MSAKITLAALCLIAPAAAALADEPARKGAVRELDIKGLVQPEERPLGKKPVEILSDEDLRKVFPAESARERILKQIDFVKEKLLFFQWTGSGGDKLEVKVTPGDKGPAVFHFLPGATLDLRLHARLFALPREAAWKVADQFVAADDPTKAVRALDPRGLKRPDKVGEGGKPAVVAGPEELKKVFEDEPTRARLLKEVDFGKEKLLVFAWEGSGADRYTFDVKKRDDALGVFFLFRPGKTDDVHRHLYLVVMPREASFSFTGQPQRGPNLPPK